MAAKRMHRRRRVSAGRGGGGPLARVATSGSERGRGGSPRAAAARPAEHRADPHQLEALARELAASTMTERCTGT